MTIEYRETVKEDKAGLFKLYKETMRSFIDDIWGWDEDWQKNDFNKLLASSYTRIIRYNGIDVGYIQTENTGDSIYIWMLIVTKDARSKNIGSSILEEIKENSKPVNLRIFRNNHRAYDFYKKNGFNKEKDEGNFIFMSAD